MPFYVAIYQQAWPEQLPQLLAAIKSSFAASRTATPGRQTARVFQRLNEPTTLLSVGEWDSQAAYEAHRSSPAFEQTMAVSGPPPDIEYLQRLHLFERMNERAVVVACVTILAPRESLAQIEEFLRGPAQLNMVATPGIVSRELYRGQAGQPVVRLLVVHGWRSLTDLERFRRADAPHFEGTLRSWGATVERFTGEIAAEYSRLERPDGW